MKLFWVTLVELLLLAVVCIASWRTKKYISKAERVAIFLMFGSMTSDFIIIMSMNNQFWKHGIQGPIPLALNLMNRVVVLPLMGTLFVNDYAGRLGLLPKLRVFGKWLLLFIGVGYLFVWLDLLRYLHWEWYWSIPEWTVKLLVTLGFYKFYQYLLRREEFL
ncbi:hypothetical protein JJB07_16640 [Tumebacillus sp. ITR2]|uniref:Uncharacterized protein n=1 Tax=Tumebacillus amylolyticus TaxID=2801339 RepID=A0ABS1JFA2_9BACL|nr:hypothetical protein [Tumebacillus amylolyticus]MBL0388243.1 hypothetical protein [Tumebacillus amylolyticus]